MMRANDLPHIGRQFSAIPNANRCVCSITTRRIPRVVSSYRRRPPANSFGPGRSRRYRNGTYLTAPPAASDSTHVLTPATEPGRNPRC
jgi:hypothetical protein